MAALPADLESDLQRIGSDLSGGIKGGVEYQKNRTGENSLLQEATAGVAHLKDQKAAEDMAQVRSYMEMTTGEPWSSDDMWESLKDGIYLCKFINALSPGAVRKVNRPGMPFKEMENITMFLEACIKFGLRQNNTFRTPDLYEKRVSYPKAIIDCILAVKRVSAKGSTKGKTIGKSWNDSDTANMRRQQAELRAKMDASPEGGSSGDTDFKNRGRSKALDEATAAVSGVADAQAEADIRAAKEWLEALTGTSYPPSGDLWEATKDGRMLCDAINKIRPGAIPKINRPGMPFKEMENITHFVGACKTLGVRESDTFRPPDLYEKRVSYPKAIINCIHALSKASKKVKGFSGPYLVTEKVTAINY
jgi:hypothetical protein